MSDTKCTIKLKKKRNKNLDLDPADVIHCLALLHVCNNVFGGGKEKPKQVTPNFFGHFIFNSEPDMSGCYDECLFSKTWCRHKRMMTKIDQGVVIISLPHAWVWQPQRAELVVTSRQMMPNNLACVACQRGVESIHFLCPLVHLFSLLEVHTLYTPSIKASGRNLVPPFPSLNRHEMHFSTGYPPVDKTVASIGEYNWQSNVEK